MKLKKKLFFYHPLPAPPQITELFTEKNFYWCIKYRVTGYPSRSREWLFNGQPLNLTDNSNIKDLESPSSQPTEFIFVDEGSSCLFDLVSAMFGQHFDRVRTSAFIHPP